MFLYALVSELNAQKGTAVKIPQQYMFPDFSVGTVRMKSGEKVVLRLNYNVVTEKMVFIQKEKIYDMIDRSAIDTVYIHGRKFVPVARRFYEVLVNAQTSLFIQHKGDIRQPPRPAAFGGTSEVSSSTYIDNLNFGGDVFRMNRKADIIIDPDPLLWIRIDNTMKMVKNQRYLLRILSDKRNEIESYIRQNQLKIENPDHMIRIIRYYNGLSD